MNSIDSQVKKLKTNHQLGLMAHAVVGYPTLFESGRIIKRLVKKGADFLELQIPFSDPIADGPTIIRACEESLGKGVNTDSAFGLIGGIMKEINIPAVIMAYYNTVFRYGLERFCQKASKMSISGLIVPDIPPEEEKNEKFISTCLKYDLYPIRVISPSSGQQRLKINAGYAKGFIYCVSHFGVTGSGVKVDRSLMDYISKVKKTVGLPVAVGFGIEKREQVEELRDIADIAVVGSAIIRNYDKGGLKMVESFIKQLKEGTI